MYALLDITSRRIFQGAFVALALFIPFSIAGMSISIGFIALAWVLSSVAGRIAPAGAHPPRLSIFRDPLFPAALLLAASALVSVAMSDDSARAWKDWQSYWQLLLYFAVASSLVASGMRETALRVLAASSILSCLVAFVQRAGGLDAGFLHIPAMHRVGSTLYTMTFAGILYQLVIFYASTSFTRGIGRSERVLFMVAAACQFVALMLTMTRGAWIAAVAGLVALALITPHRVARLAVAGVLALLLAFSFFYSRDEGRTLSPTALMGSSPDRNVHTRLVLWDIAWDLFREHPVFGVGMGDYESHASKMAEGRNVRTAVDAHNVPLQVLATRGIFGFLPFLYFWFTVLRVLVRTIRTTPAWSRAHQYALGGLAVAVAVLVGSLTENNIYDEEVFTAFMFLLGAARAEAYRPRAGGENAASGPTPS